jgi:hypothetical protein
MNIKPLSSEAGGIFARLVSPLAHCQRAAYATTGISPVFAERAGGEWRIWQGEHSPLFAFVEYTGHIYPAAFQSADTGASVRPIAVDLDGTGAILDVQAQHIVAHAAELWLMGLESAGVTTLANGGHAV